MDDDFNTALAIGHLFEAVRAMNRLIGREEIPQECRQGRRRAGSSPGVLALGGVLGLLAPTPPTGWSDQKLAALPGLGITAEEIEALIASGSRPAGKRISPAPTRSARSSPPRGSSCSTPPEGTEWKVR